MEILLLILISMLGTYIVVGTHQSLMVRFGAYISIFILTMVLTGFFPIGSVETVNSIKEKVGSCRHKAPDAVYCVIKIKLTPDTPTEK